MIEGEAGSAERMSPEDLESAARYTAEREARQDASKRRR